MFLRKSMKRSPIWASNEAPLNGDSITLVGIFLESVECYHGMDKITN